MAGNHDHSQLDLLLGRKFVAMFPVVIFDFNRRNNLVGLDVVATHRAHNKFFHLLLFELTECVILCLERFDKRVAVAAKRFPDDLLDFLVHEVIGNFVAFLLKRLNYEPTIYQIF